MVKQIAIVSGCLSAQGGGVPRSVSRQALILKEKGINVSLYAGYSKKYPFTPAELDIEECATYTSALWGPGVLGFFPKALYQLWKQAGRFDVIHLNGGWNLTTFLGALIARNRNVPYIISCRSHYGDYHFSRKPFLKKLLFLLLERTNVRHALALHVTADWETKTSRRVVEHAKAVVKIPNPVNLSDFQDPPSRKESRGKLNLNSNGFYILHLGRLGKQKNLPFLLEAFHKAKLGADAHLILIGPPELDEKQKMEQRVAELGLNDHVRFINFTEGRERCHWFSAVNIFALPSFDENFCVSAIESIASGTPCLLSPYVGATEFLPENLAKELPLDMGVWVEALESEFVEQKEQQTPPSDALDAFSSTKIGDAWLEFYNREGSRLS